MSEPDHEAIIHALGERVKELRGMHTVALALRDTAAPLDQVAQAVADALPPAMQWPERCVAELIADEQVARSRDFAEPEVTLEAEVATRHGARVHLRVGYRGVTTTGRGDPFLDEERDLVRWVGEALLEHLERRHAEALLRDQQALVHIASRMGRLGAWSVDVASLRYRWSGATRELHEVDPGAEPTLEGLFSFYPPEDRALLEACIERCRDHGEPFDATLRFVTARGRARWVRVIGEAVRDLHGTVVTIQGAIQDVTEQRETERSLRESDERFRILARATNDAAWDWDLDHNTLWWNDGYQALFGWDVGLGLPDLASWTAHIHPEDREQVLASLHAAIDGDATTWSSEYRFLRSDGSIAYVFDRGQVIRDRAGRARRMIGGMSDITERRRAELKLREQAALLDQARDAISVRTLDGTISYWNRRAERLYGWPSAQAMGRSIVSLFGDDPMGYQHALAELLRAGEWTGELDAAGANGRPVTIQAHWTLVRDGAGEPRSILAIETDVTAQRRLERQLMRTQRLESLGTMAGGVAHDLNNVLSPILMATSMLREAELDPEHEQDLATIERCALRGAEMVRQLLTFSRGAEGERAPLRLSQIAEDVRRIVQDTFPKNIRVTLDAVRESSSVVADATQMHQLILNLCLNARDAMPNGGSLALVIESQELDELQTAGHPGAHPGPYVCVRVEDTGVGMPGEMLERIFEPFFTTKDPGRGTGLGLATVHAIVRGHRGFVQVFSEPRVGTRFLVYLPASPSGTGTGHVRPQQARSDLYGRGELVLVVDDEEPIRDIARRILERFGYGVLLAANGVDAVARFAARRDEIAVVLADLAMPIMDGPAMIVALRSIEPAVRVVASSGLADGDLMGRARAAGIDATVPKPYTAESLLLALARVLAERRGEPAPNG